MLPEITRHPNDTTTCEGEPASVHCFTIFISDFDLGVGRDRYITRLFRFESIMQGSDPEGKKPLEKPPENPPENQLEISYTGKSPKIGSLDMS